YTPDGLISQVVDPALGSVEYTYLADGTAIEKVEYVDGATSSVLERQDYYYDELGRISSVVQFSTQEEIEQFIGYDDLGRQIALARPDGTKTVALIDPVDGLDAGYEIYDRNDVLQSRLSLARDGAGLVQSATLHYLSDPTLS